MREVVDKARELFVTGCRLPAWWTAAWRIDLDLFSRGGMRVLEKIEQQGYDVLARAAGDLEAGARRLLLGSLARVALRAGGVMDGSSESYEYCRGVARSRAKNFYYSFRAALARSSATPCAPSTPSCATATT